MSSYVLAISGASALQLGERTLQTLLNNNKNISLILSKGAYKVFLSERRLNIPIDPIRQESFWRERLNSTKGKLICYKWDDMAAIISSGSHKTKGMLIVPCSMGTVGRVASGFSLDLIERCADVHLKEGRPLIIVPREMPWNLIHLRNLTSLAEAGAKIAPPIPAWYTNPCTLDDMIDFLVMKILDTLGENNVDNKRWEGSIK